LAGGLAFLVPREVSPRAQLNLPCPLAPVISGSRILVSWDRLCTTSGTNPCLTCPARRMKASAMRREHFLCRFLAISIDRPRTASRPGLGPNSIFSRSRPLRLNTSSRHSKGRALTPLRVCRGRGYPRWGPHVVRTTRKKATSNTGDQGNTKGGAGEVQPQGQVRVKAVRVRRVRRRGARHPRQPTVATLLQPDHDAVGRTTAIDHGEPHEAGPLRLEE
jgi:hypothetical protein